MESNMLRVMWLLNYTSIREAEISMLKEAGVTEIFLPKKYPSDLKLKNLSVDFSEDSGLSIPAADLEILNDTDWYDSPSSLAWELANRYFEILFFILTPAGKAFKNIVDNFKGSVILRAYGESGLISYSKQLKEFEIHSSKNLIESLGNRFWFAQAYPHLYNSESDYLARRSISLPLPFPEKVMGNEWKGTSKKVLFFCPDIVIDEYSGQAYLNFISDFKNLPSVIGGTQSIQVNDSAVLGHLSPDELQKTICQMRVVFCYKAEQDPIYHNIFEAIRIGIPVIFMADGLLDTLAGKRLPGSCKTIVEARRKISRILNDDWGLINRIKKSQIELIDSINSSACVNSWISGLSQIRKSLNDWRLIDFPVRKRKKRIAVIIPIPYRGGSLRGAKLLAQSIAVGSMQRGESVDVVLGYLAESTDDAKFEFSEFDKSVKTRVYQWSFLNTDEACRAMAYAGLEFTPSAETYQIPNDGMNQFLDCDLWIFISDRLEHAILPIRPYVCMVYDYLQRFESILSPYFSDRILNAAYNSQQIFVTTDFTKKQAINYAGIPAEKVLLLPMLVPEFHVDNQEDRDRENPNYFVWTTNLAPHKNHQKAFEALRIYYESLDGKLSCHVTGFSTALLLKTDFPHLKPLNNLWSSSQHLRSKVKLLNELPDLIFQKKLFGSAFLWHPARMDNGTFSVIEAAYLRVPSLSSDYPAMREIDEQFSLNLAWMDPYDSQTMALQLKRMEEQYNDRREKLPNKDQLKEQSLESLSSTCWDVIRQCL
jgi:glycosyltransferase involved in cell wall biosynthesis